MKYDALLFTQMDVRIGQFVYGIVSHDSKKRFPDGCGIRTSHVKEIVIDSEGSFILTGNSVYKLVQEQDIYRCYDTHDFGNLLHTYEDRPLYAYIDQTYYRVRGVDFGHHPSVAVIELDREIGYSFQEIQNLHGE